MMEQRERGAAICNYSSPVGSALKVRAGTRLAWNLIACSHLLVRPQNADLSALSSDAAKSVTCELPAGAIKQFQRPSRP